LIDADAWAAACRWAGPPCTSPRDCSTCMATRCSGRTWADTWCEFKAAGISWAVSWFKFSANVAWHLPKYFLLQLLCSTLTERKNALRAMEAPKCMSTNSMRRTSSQHTPPCSFDPAALPTCTFTCLCAHRPCDARSCLSRQALCPSLHNAACMAATLTAQMMASCWQQ